MEGLTKERMGEIAIIAFLQMKREEGILLKPKEMKRTIHNEAQRHGTSLVETALFAKFVLEKTYAEAMEEINSIITGRG